MGNEDIDHEYTDTIVCPYCGYKHEDVFEFSDDGETDCYKCGKEFSFTRIVTVEYSTEKIEE
jgi:DNA-directed RNA polymerase subunit RPC12/RpoP